MKKLLTDLTIPGIGMYDPRKGISQSQLKDFMQCRMKWLFRINGLSHPDKYKKTFFGDITHKLLSRYYYEILNKGVKTFCPAVWAESFTKQYRRIQDPQFLETESCIASTVVEEYIKFYKGDKQFKVKLNEQELNYKGRCVKIDLLISNGGKCWVFEHKCMSRIDEEGITLKLAMDFQVLYYLTTLRLVLPEEQILGVQYNIIRKPALKPKTNDTMEDFCQRIRKDITDRPEWYFYRYPITYTKQDEARFDADMNAVRADLNMCLCDRKRIYRNTNLCLLPYKCEYLDACSSGDCSFLIKSK